MFLYLAVVLNAFFRRIVDWVMRTNLKTQLVLDAMNMAVRQRRPSNVIIKATRDRSTRPWPSVSGTRRRVSGRSWDRSGDAYDNAICESFCATLERELHDRRKFRTKAEARMAIFEFIEGWHYPGRRHSALG